MIPSDWNALYLLLSVAASVGVAVGAILGAAATIAALMFATWVDLAEDDTLEDIENG